MPDETGTVSRTLQLLCCFSEQEQWRVSELGERLQLPRSTVHRLLNLCRSQGFIDSDGQGTYVSGLALYRLAGRLSIQMPIRRIVLPLLTEFTKKFGEISLLTLLDRPALKMFFAAKAEVSAPMRYVIETDVLGPLGWGATGRAILAFMSDAEIAEVIRRAEPSPSDGRALDIRELRRSLARIRTHGYAITQKQRTLEGVGIAVPFFDAAGKIIGDIGVTVPSFRFQPRKEAVFVRALTEIVTEASKALGSVHSRAELKPIQNGKSQSL